MAKKEESSDGCKDRSLNIIGEEDGQLCAEKKKREGSSDSCKD